MLYDTHAHLNDEIYKDDLAEVLARAGAADVRLINVVGYDLASSEEAVRLARKYRERGLRAVIGIHPHDADQWGEDAEKRLRQLAEDDKGPERVITAIGEIGLDYHFDERHPDALQIEAFKGQMRLACELDLPFVVHDRDAHLASLTAIREIKEEGKLRAVPGVFHCYSGSVEFSRELLELGFYLGFDGPVTFKNGKKPLAAASAVPLERLLTETDCPYLTPSPFRGKRNEPAYLKYILEVLAQARGLSYDELAAITFRNGCRLFGIGEEELRDTDEAN